MRFTITAKEMQELPKELNGIVASDEELKELETVIREHGFYNVVKSITVTDKKIIINTYF